MTNDGLLAYRHAAGAAGSVVVPNLATTVPQPSEDGLTYTFQLRREIRYSSGEIVGPEDIRRGIERMFRLRTAFGFANLVGADACNAKPARCDLSELGISINQPANTITFDLAREDPDFIANLASPDIVAVPPDTPDEDTSSKPVPATGPYMIDKFVPGQRVELVRNKLFRVWSSQAQPDGYPDRIVWLAQEGEDADAQLRRAVSAVEQGKADVFGIGLDQPTDELLLEIRTRLPGQVHDYLELGSFYMFLNTELPPFDNVLVRRAINYAVDRNKVLRLYPGAGEGGVACQVIPPNFLGYQPYCPYTVDPNAAGSYQGPDFAAAQQLVEKSGTRGARIKVVECCGFVDVADYVVEVLDSLGYDASLTTGPRPNTTFEDFFEFLSYFADSKRNKVHMAGFWAVAGSTSPIGWVNALTCDAIDRADPLNNPNEGFFCDRELDDQIMNAIEVQGANPAASVPLWIEIDRAATDEAPRLTLLTEGGVDFVSDRVGNYQHNPAYGILLDQLWVT
jgi:peptide/nickel transport system substrate-binding protein